MFIVINEGNGSAAYQLAYAYNSRELRARKYESGKWSEWRA